MRSLAISPGTYFRDGENQFNNFLGFIQIRGRGGAGARLEFDIIMVDLSVGRMIVMERVVHDRPIEEFWEEIYQEISLYRPHEV